MNTNRVDAQLDVMNPSAWTMASGSADPFLTTLPRTINALSAGGQAQGSVGKHAISNAAAPDANRNVLGTFGNRIPAANLWGSGVVG
jgi:hypothetical protein